MFTAPELSDSVGNSACCRDIETAAVCEVMKSWVKEDAGLNFYVVEEQRVFTVDSKPLRLW